MIFEVVQILLGDDLELRAYGSLTYARCIMAGAGAGESAISVHDTTQLNVIVQVSMSKY